MSGITYVPAPQERYDGVMAFSVPAEGTTIPSGSTVVEGIYYLWNNEGFIGRGWMYEVQGGPTNKFQGFKSNEDVAAYVIEYGSLNEVFKEWSLNYTLEEWHGFYMAVGVGSGCMDVVHST